jgi:hypothetical protein
LHVCIMMDTYNFAVCLRYFWWDINPFDPLLPDSKL